MSFSPNILKPKINPILTGAETTNTVKRSCGEKERIFFTFRLHIIFLNFTRPRANANNRGKFLRVNLNSVNVPFQRNPLRLQTAFVSQPLQELSSHSRNYFSVQFLWLRSRRGTAFGSVSCEVVDKCIVS